MPVLLLAQYPWVRTRACHCRRSRLARAQALNICLATDVFPPGSGGSGWSTYYLGKALLERGHNVWVVKPVYGDVEENEGFRRSEYGGLVVDEAHVPAPP